MFRSDALVPNAADESDKKKSRMKYVRSFDDLLNILLPKEYVE